MVLIPSPAKKPSLRTFCEFSLPGLIRKGDLLTLAGFFFAVLNCKFFPL